MKASALPAVVLASLFSVAGCVVEQGDEAPASTTEQAAKPAACTGICIDGYVFNPKKCACQPACTTTALCVAGYRWDELSCRCVRNR